MTMLLELRDAYKRYGEQELLAGASVTLAADQKVGMIGRNGAGKTTLCRILLGEEELDSGQLTLHPRLKLGYLRQHDPFEPGETVHQFLIRDTEQPDWKCGEVAAQFELKGPMLDRPLDELSGGWRTRVKLAALLLHEPNMLLLDEPTNFLDLRTQLLLEHFLRNFRGACLIVSHERGFLKATCDRTLEIDRGRLTMFAGDVDVYLENIRERQDHDERVNASVAAKRRQLETFINQNRANANTASQARSKAKQLERLKLTELEAPPPRANIRVPDVEPRQGAAVRCIDLEIGYGDLKVATEINLEIEHGARAAVVGDNGQGKTTFLRTVTDSLEALGGSVRWGYGCNVGVYAQHVYASLPGDDTVQDYLQYVAAPETRTQAVLDTAGSFLFRGDDVEKKIKVLSGGERARLTMAGLLLGGFNVLVLDEPGNHLDVETVEALADALRDYRGTIVFTSHDRSFMQRVATSVIEVREGRVADYQGDYGTYLYRVEKEIDDGLRSLGAAAPVDDPNASRQARKSNNQRRRSARKEITNLERKIARLDDHRRELQQQLLSSTDATEAQDLHEQITTVAGEISELEGRWFELQESDGVAE